MDPEIPGLRLDNYSPGLHKGTKVGSIAWPSAPHRPDLRRNLQPAIFPREILEFAATRVYIVTVLQLVIWAWLIFGLRFAEPRQLRPTPAMEAIVSYRQIVHRSCRQRDHSATCCGTALDTSWPCIAIYSLRRLDGGFGPIGLALTPNEATE